jgi:CheY-like chemotaxis protein
MDTYRLKHIMVVDDDPSHQSMVLSALGRMGYECEVASNAFEALEKLSEDSFDLVISDIVMPEKDGIELMKEARALLPDLDFIIMTGHSGDYSYSDIVAAGARDYLMKPFTKAELKARLERIERERGNELELRKHRDHLEKLVTKRTAELDSANKRLRQVQKLEAIGTLAKGIAHEFNNILTPIMAFSEIMLEQAAEDDSFREELQIIVDSACRARDLVSQIMTFARTEGAERQIIRMGPFLKEIMKQARSSIPATIKVDVNILTKKDVVMADPVQIQQVVMNICTNSAQAMQEGGGALEVRLQDAVIMPESMEIRALGVKPGPYLKLTVSDTGHGMDQTIVDRIFDPFFTTRQPGEGSGLGLSVVYGIVADYGGTITVETAPGRGTTFCVFLPGAEHELAEEPFTVSSSSGTGKCILVVDDDKLVLLAAVGILESLGYRVVAITSSLEALELFRATPDELSLVITDLTMPHMTGLELAEELHKIRPGTPIILCTGYGGMTNRGDAAATGIVETVRKPFSRQTMAEAVQRVLRDGATPFIPLMRK